jgi:MFS family permease
MTTGLPVFDTTVQQTNEWLRAVESGLDCSRQDAYSALRAVLHVLRDRLTIDMVLVLMSTLVVGPFYLSIALGLKAAMVGVVMSVGPLLSALTGVPAGRLVDRIGALQISILGLFGILLGCGLLVVLPETLGVAGYVGPVAMITVSYALFQAANNTAIMKDVVQQDRGVTSGLLNLSRNLGLVTGTSVMGAIFALGVGSPDVAAAGSDAVVSGMHLAFTVSAAFVVLALLAAGLNLSFAARNASPEGEA